MVVTKETVIKRYGDKDGYVFCDSCPLYDDSLGSCKCGFDETCDGYEKAYNYIMSFLMGDIPTGEDTEKVNHPSHYNADGAMECIDEMLLIFGKEATMHFCLCNAWKYRYRANDKNGKEDMDKANWYIAKYKELKEEA